MDSLARQTSGLVISKRWTVNGAITPKARESYYYIDTTDSNNGIIEMVTDAAAAAKMSCLMMHGPRGSGKTTRAYRLCEQLEERGHTCALMSFQEGVPFHDRDRFWRAMGVLIDRHVCRRKRLPECGIADASGFHSFFEREDVKSLDLVILVDEFDLLCSADKPLQGELLNTLRSLTQRDKQEHGLRALIAIGPFSILKLRKETSSPFNVTDPWVIPRFKRVNVQQMFKEYSEQTGVVVAREIPDAIYEFTNGHAGLISFCGKKISEHLAKGKTHVAYETWVEYTSTRLIPDLRTGWATMSNLVTAIRTDNELVADARSFLVEQFLTQNPPTEDDPSSDDEEDPQEKEQQPHGMTVFTPGPDDHQRKLCNYLASEGVLRAVDSDHFTMASFLIRNMVAWAIRSEMPRPPQLLEFSSLPLQGGNYVRLDIPKMVEVSLRAFDKERMRKAPTISNKLSRRFNWHRTVPSESCYHHELSHALATWLNGQYDVVSQVNAPMARPKKEKRPERQRCDMRISTKSNSKERWCCALELCASAKPGEVKNHFDQVLAYGKALKADEKWMINFDVHGNGFTPALLLWPTRDENEIGVVHVIHDISWELATLYVKMPNEEGHGKRCQVKLKI